MSGGNKQTQTQQKSETVNPWAPSQPALNQILAQAQGLLGNTGANANENAALGGLANNAQTAGGYAPQIQGLTDQLFSGGGYGAGIPGLNEGYATARDTLSPIASMSADPSQNPQLQGLLSSLQSQVNNSVGGQFAAAGRSFSGAHAGALGKGQTDALAPYLFNQYNQNMQDKMNAANSLSALGINTSAGLDAAAGNQLGAQMQAPGSFANFNIPQNMALDAEQQRRNLPINNLAAAQNLILPIAQLGRQGTSSATNTTQVQEDPMKLALGAALGLGGMALTGGGSGILSGMGGGGGLLAGLGGSGLMGAGFKGQKPSSYASGLPWAA